MPRLHRRRRDRRIGVKLDPLVDIKLTDHAKVRMAEMSVTRRDLRRAITDPDVECPSHGTRDKHGNPTGRRAATARCYVRDGIAVVADPSTPGRVVVVTVLPRTAEMYEREGAAA